jgi:hypothetical protein
MYKMNLARPVAVPFTGNYLRPSAALCPPNDPSTEAMPADDDTEDEEFDDEARPHVPDVSEEEELGQAEELADDEE